MGFKAIKDYNNELYSNLFLLRTDGEEADVVFMYRSEDDVLIADTHYIKSADYSGYVHCCGAGCPACKRKIRVQTKLFVPLYNIGADEIQFWDRSSRFQNNLYRDVLSKYPNPSNIVFGITRKGNPGDINTEYDITAKTRNSIGSYEQILANKGVSLPEYYSVVCREYSIPELEKILDTSNYGDGQNSGGGGNYVVGESDLPDYKLTARNPVRKDEEPEAELIDSSLFVKSLDEQEPQLSEIEESKDIEQSDAVDTDNKVDSDDDEEVDF